MKIYIATKTSVGHAPTPGHKEWWMNTCDAAHKFCASGVPIHIVSTDEDHIRNLAKEAYVERDPDLVRIVATYPDLFRFDGRALYATLECGTEPLLIRVAGELRGKLRMGADRGEEEQDGGEQGAAVR